MKDPSHGEQTWSPARNSSVGALETRDKHYWQPRCERWREGISEGHRVLQVSRGLSLLPLSQCLKDNSEYSVSVQNSENIRNTGTSQDFNIKWFWSSFSFWLYLSQCLTLLFPSPIACLWSKRLAKIQKRKGKGGEKPPLHLLAPGARTWWRRSTLAVSVFAIKWCKPTVLASDRPSTSPMVKQHMLAVWYHHFNARLYSLQIISWEKLCENSQPKRNKIFLGMSCLLLHTVSMRRHNCE